MNSTTAEISKKHFRQWTLALLAYTLLVILWGAWVRISHSGDGCGASWPLCQGQILPEVSQTKTWVELSHRLTSGLFGLLVLATFFWARRLFAKGTLTRRMALFSLIFTVTEALLGAKLVLLGLVAGNDSPLRAIAMSLHFVNSLLLVGSITLLWEFAREPLWQRRKISPWSAQQFKLKHFGSSVTVSFSEFKRSNERLSARGSQPVCGRRSCRAY